MPNKSVRDDAVILIAGLLVAGSGFLLPDWIRFSIQMSLGIGLATLGVVLLMRCGLLSLGQGLFYCIGGYAIAFTQKYAGTTDIFAALVFALLAAFVASVILTVLLSRYREIFFAMLTLAVSMVLYGTLIKSSSLGSSDGLNVSAPTFLGFKPVGEDARLVMYAFAVMLTAVAVWLIRRFMRSDYGKVSEAMRTNELRVVYLGYRTNVVVGINFCLSALLGSAGGLIVGASARHVDPMFAYWTTSAEFIFAALIGGHASVYGPLVGAILLEALRVVSQEIAPSLWQLILGGAMLAIILATPEGVFRAIEKLTLSRIRK